MDEEDWDEDNDGVDMTVGETIAEAWWYSDGGGPISWNGNNRVANLGGGRWAVMQSGDDGEEFDEVEEPKSDDDLVSILCDFALERYTTQSALALETIDPDEALSQTVRDRISALIDDWSGEFGAAIFNVESSIAERLRVLLANASEDYLLARHALHNPLDASSADFFAQMLDGIDSWEDVLDEDKAQVFMDQRRESKRIEDEKRVRVEEARMVAADGATQPPELQALLLLHGQGVWTEVESNPNVTRAVLEDWAQSGPDEILGFIAECELCDAELVRVLASRADRYLGQELMAFERSEVAAIEGLLMNPDPRSRILVASDWEWFYEDADPPVQAALVEAWRRLALDPDDSVREAAAAAWQRNLGASEPLSDYIVESATSNDEERRVNAASSKVLPDHILSELAHDSSTTVRLKVAQRSALSPDVVAVLIGDTETKVRCHIARSQHLDNEQFRQLAEDTESAVREQVANRPATPEAVIEMLAEDEDLWVKVAVAGRPRLQERVVERLLSDPDPRVRRGLAVNPGVSLEMLTSLSRDPDPAVREALRTREG